MKVPTLSPGNIWSGSKTLAVFTNPTELAFRKGNLKYHYPITWNGTDYPDVESAYQQNKPETLAQRAKLITELIEIKLKMYIIIPAAIVHNGGTSWLHNCCHWTSSKSKVWEGNGNQSLFIRCLIAAYENTIWNFELYIQSRNKVVNKI
jgi:hypothetical protein